MLTQLLQPVAFSLFKTWLPFHKVYSNRKTKPLCVDEISDATGDMSNVIGLRANRRNLRHGPHRNGGPNLVTLRESNFHLLYVYILLSSIPIQVIELHF